MPLNATPAIAGGRPPADIDTLQCASMLPCLTKVTCTDCLQL
ncbi:hypothetical protein [Pseudoalteromonas phenolica]|nr:hypothetical protein [Pseudoalteromonas phenolica]